MQDNKGVGGIRRQYWKSDSQNFELNKRGPIKPSSAVTAPNFSADRAEPLFVPSSTSEERTMESYTVHGIRKTLEVEVKNEAAGNSNDGREAYEQSWNIA